LFAYDLTKRKKELLARWRLNQSPSIDFVPANIDEPKRSPIKQINKSSHSPRHDGFRLTWDLLRHSVHQYLSFLVHKQPTAYDLTYSNVHNPDPAVANTFSLLCYAKKNGFPIQVPRYIYRMRSLQQQSTQKPALLIIYQSMTGGTEQMARACAQGAQTEAGVHVELKQARDANHDDFVRAQAYVIATPEYLGAMGGLVKDCLDRSYYQVIDQIQARPYAAMICAGSDGQGAAKQLERIVTGWRLKAVTPPLIVNVAAQTPKAILAPKELSQEQLKPCIELGRLMAMGLSMSIF